MLVYVIDLDTYTNIYFFKGVDATKPPLSIYINNKKIMILNINMSDLKSDLKSMLLRLWSIKLCRWIGLRCISVIYEPLFLVIVILMYLCIQHFFVVKFRSNSLKKIVKYFLFNIN